MKLRTLVVLLAGLFPSLALAQGFELPGPAGSGIEMEEIDGSPDQPDIRRIRVTSGTLTFDGVVSGKRQMTLATGGGTGGSSITLDLDDDGANETTALAEIAVVNRANNVFTFVPANQKFLIDQNAPWKE